MSKKLITACLFILLALVLVFPACSQSTNTPQPTSASQPAQTSVAPGTTTASPSQTVVPTQAQATTTYTLIYEHKIPASHNLANNEKPGSRP